MGLVLRRHRHRHRGEEGGRLDFDFGSNDADGADNTLDFGAFDRRKI
jgi:hypothetical protein